MTITFPTTLPSELLARLSTTAFELDWMQEYAPTRGGLVIARDLGPALWMASFQSARLQAKDFLSVETWLDTLSGSLNTFYAYDVRRTNAIAYPAGYGSLTRPDTSSFSSGTCFLAGVAGDNVTITLGSAGTPSTALPAGFQITKGDYVAFDYTDTRGVTVRALHRFVASATASGSGVLSAEVRPFVRATAAGSTAQLLTPSGKFLLNPKSVRKNLNPAGYGTIAFQGLQTLG